MMRTQELSRGKVFAVFLSDVGGVGGVVSTLKEFKVSESAIASIEAFLTSQEETLSQNKDGQDDGGHDMFGVGWSGVNLGTHESKADAFLTNTIVETAAALNLLIEAMRDFSTDVGKTVADDEDRTRVLLNQVSQARDLKDEDQNTPAEGWPRTDGEGA